MPRIEATTINNARPPKYQNPQNTKKGKTKETAPGAQAPGTTSRPSNSMKDMATRALLGLAAIHTMAPHTANANVLAMSDATPPAEDNATATTPWATDNVIYTAIATLIGVVVIAGPVVGTVIAMTNRTPSDTADRPERRRHGGFLGEDFMADF